MLLLYARPTRSVWSSSFLNLLPPQLADAMFVTPSPASSDLLERLPWLFWRLGLPD